MPAPALPGALVKTAGVLFPAVILSSEIAKLRSAKDMRQ